MDGPRFYRRKATVEAMQWTGDAECAARLSAWLGSDRVATEGPSAIISGATRAEPGNWVVLSPSGRLHICMAETFGEVHELALADPPDSPQANMAAGINAARGAANYWKALAQMLARKAGEELPTPPAGPVSGD